jgi:hypothetical protein
MLVYSGLYIMVNHGRIGIEPTIVNEDDGWELNG